MPLFNQIENDYQQAYKEKNENVVSTLRMLLAALKNEKINKKADLEEEDVIKILKTEIKKHKESIKEYENADRQELADKEQKELEVLEKYMPDQLGEEEIKQKIQEIIKQAGDDANFGQIMGKVMQELKGQADGALVKQILEQELK